MNIYLTPELLLALAVERDQRAARRGRQRAPATDRRLPAAIAGGAAKATTLQRELIACALEAAHRQGMSIDAIRRANRLEMRVASGRA